MSTIKLDLNGDSVSISFWDIIENLDAENKNRLLEIFTFEEIVSAIENQLKKGTDLYSWDTSGWRDGSKIREAILNIQGLEPEFKADLESKIRSLENSVAHYKKYYDWYFRIYHCDRYPRENGQESLMQHVERLVGSPDKQLPKETP